MHIEKGSFITSEVSRYFLLNHKFLIMKKYEFGRKKLGTYLLYIPSVNMSCLRSPCSQVYIED